MYQQQLINLMQAFHQASDQRYNWHRLFNDSDYRNQALQRAKTQVTRNSHRKILLLVNQIQRLEDLLHHELQVDMLPAKQVKPKQERKQRWGMAALAFSCLFFIAASVMVVEEVKHNQQQPIMVQAD